MARNSSRKKTLCIDISCRFGWVGSSHHHSIKGRLDRTEGYAQKHGIQMDVVCKDEASAKSVKQQARQDVARRRAVLEEAEAAARAIRRRDRKLQKRKTAEAVQAAKTATAGAVLAAVSAAALQAAAPTSEGSGAGLEAAVPTSEGDDSAAALEAAVPTSEGDNEARTKAPKASTVESDEMDVTPTTPSGLTTPAAAAPRVPDAPVHGKSRPRVEANRRWTKSEGEAEGQDRAPKRRRT